MLDKLYYDYDKYNIRKDAAEELDKVVALMKLYASMEVELGSHTDARGSDAYNEWLSQKRAEASVAYILSKGIAQQRITAKGFGENQLVNKCANGVNCSDAEHQKNRITEVKITRFEESGIEIRKQN